MLPYHHIHVFDSDGNQYLNDVKSHRIQIVQDWTDYWKYYISEDIYVHTVAILLPMVFALMMLPILESKKKRFHKKTDQK